LPPGPPYILHEKDFEQIEVKKIAQFFKLGPLSFITVRDGDMVGAYHRETSDYHILPPGHTYKIHSKDYDFYLGQDRVKRSNEFRLGPWFFVTVQEGYVAGAYRRHGGDWLELPHGYTYQLNTDIFEKPIMRKLDSDLLKCGPMTYLTVNKKKLAGAWRVRDGYFQIFEDHNQLYRLSEQEYYGLAHIDKHSPETQQFGPYQVIIIPEGKAGVFEKSGKLEIKKPGLYRVDFEYIIRESIPINVKTTSLIGKQFLSKDGTKMSTNCTLVWKVEDVESTAHICRHIGFEKLEGFIKQLLNKCVTKYCKTYNRSQLLPTKQDIIVKAGEDVDPEVLSNLLGHEIKNTAAVYTKIEECMKSDMVKANEISKWGIFMSSIKLEGFETLDPVISGKLADITVALLNASEERINGDLEITKAEIEKQLKIKQLETETFVRKLKTKTDAKVRKINASSKAEVKKIESESKAATQVIKLRSDNEVYVENAITDVKAKSEAEKIRLAIECKEIKLKAETEATAIDLTSQAQHHRACKVNEAASKMSKKQFELQKANKGADAMKKIGNANWRMPNKILQFYETFTPYLRMGPMTAHEILNTLDDKKN